jgi:hypothetical protein
MTAQVGVAPPVSTRCNADNATVAQPKRQLDQLSQIPAHSFGCSRGCAGTHFNREFSWAVSSWPTLAAYEIVPRLRLMPRPATFADSCRDHVQPGGRSMSVRPTNCRAITRRDRRVWASELGWPQARRRPTA